MNIHEFQTLLEKNPLQISPPSLNEIIKKFSFHVITQENQDEIQNFQQTNQKNIFIIDEHTNSKINDSFFIVCFDYTIIITQTSDKSLIYSLFTRKNESTIYYLAEDMEKKIEIHQSNQFHFVSLTNGKSQHLISQFLGKFKLVYTSKTKSFQELFWNIVKNSISAFLIQVGFLNSKNDKLYSREKLFRQNVNENVITKEEYIKLKSFGNGSASYLDLVYLIKREKICIMKKFSNKIDKNHHFFEREHNNYINMHHPLLPQYYGNGEEDQMKSLFIEYIEGKTLDEIKIDEISIENKTKMLFEIMIILEYFHS